jgi:hypothetical protein
MTGQKTPTDFDRLSFFLWLDVVLAKGAEAEKYCSRVRRLRLRCGTDRRRRRASLLGMPVL